MSFLSKIESGIIQKPMFLTVYGTPKVGKTTFAAGAPKPIILDIEKGSRQISIDRLYPNSYSEVLAMLQELSTAKHDFKTVILDSLDHMEPWVWAKVCEREKAPSIEKVGGGFQKGYAEALKEWREILTALQKCRDEKNMNVICIAHVHIKNIQDPTKEVGYSKYELKIHNLAAALFKESSDAILFAREEIIVKTESKTKGRAVGVGERVLYTQGMPGHEGGNRYGLPYALPLEWEAFQKGVQDGSSENIRIQIQSLTDQLHDTEMKKRIEEAVKKASEDRAALQRILMKLQQIIDKQELPKEKN